MDETLLDPTLPHDTFISCDEKGRGGRIHRRMGCASSAPSSARRKRKNMKGTREIRNGGYSDQAVANIFDEAGNAVRQQEEGVISFNEPANFKMLSDKEDYMKSRILDPSRKASYKFLDKSTTWSPDAGDYLEKKIERDKHRFEMRIEKVEEEKPPEPEQKVEAPKKSKKGVRKIKRMVKKKKVGLVTEGEAKEQQPEAGKGDGETKAEDATAEKKPAEGEDGIPKHSKAVAEGGSLKDPDLSEPSSPEISSKLNKVLETLLKIEEAKEKEEEAKAAAAEAEKLAAAAAAAAKAAAEAAAKAAAEAAAKAAAAAAAEASGVLPKAVAEKLQAESEKVEAEELAVKAEGDAGEVTADEAGETTEIEDEALEDTADITDSSVSLEDVTTIADDVSEAAVEDTATTEVVKGSTATKDVPTGEAAVSNGAPKNETHDGA